MMGLLNSKKAVVTGTNRGIGLEVVKSFLGEGATVGASFRKESGELIELKNQYKDNLHLFSMDVTDSYQVKQAMREIIKKLDGIDILVNNAGISEPSLFFMMSEDSFHNVVDTNLNGTYNVMKQAIIPMTKRRSGSIINVSSVNGLVGTVGQSSYCASKAAVIGLTKSVAREIGPKNIRVNCVAPGYIDTDMVSGLNDEQIKNLIDQIPLKRFGTVEETANLITFLASDKASYITGQVFVMDGGLIC